MVHQYIFTANFYFTHLAAAAAPSPNYTIGPHQKNDHVVSKTECAMAVGPLVLNNTGLCLKILEDFLYDGTTYKCIACYLGFVVWKSQNKSTHKRHFCCEILTVVLRQDHEPHC